MVKIVGPGVEDVKAFVLNALSAVLFNIILNEFKVSLVSRDGVLQVVFIDLLFGVADEGVNGLDARRTLKVLGLDLLVHSRGETFEVCGSESFEKSQQNLLESLEIPVLIDASVNDSGAEDLLGLLTEKVHKVSNSVKLSGILEVS